MTTITSNGSKWYGEAPDSIDKLLEVLKENTLDPRFIEYGNFIIADVGSVRFFGNFRDLSHVFNIRTDDPAIIAKLSRAIHENLRRDDYRAALAEKNSHITADDIKHKLKDARYADGHNAWPSAEAMTADVSAELRRRGIPHSPAQYDTAGNCLTCGECGRCPGVHTFEEIQKAAREAAQMTALPLPAFRVTYGDGESYVTSMAAGVTLAEARAYFVGTRHTMSDEKTTKTVATVEEMTP
jgi:hypothetical protein